MALTKDITKTISGFDGVVTAADCYIKVTHITGDKKLITFTAAFINKNSLLDSTRYVFKPDMLGENFIKQAYIHLKTLPEFEGAVDV